MDNKSNNQPFIDHRELGREMELFINLDVSPGAPALLENGVILYRELESFMAEFLARRGGFREVRAPALAKTSLWQQSGHLEKFGDEMFIFGEGEQQIGLKPMNCPLHMLIYKSGLHSYRDLPYRIHDRGILHRNESSGALLGMARLSQFHQDDTHIFLAPDQIESEIQRCLDLIDAVYSAFKFRYRATLQTRPERFLGDEALWARAEGILAEALKVRGIEYVIAEGAGAFYGPKIGFEINDCLDRWWQLATVQVDFNLPERFELSYIDSAGKGQRPVVFHLAIFGAVERFMAIYLEHSRGELPLRFAPQQVRVYPVADRHVEYAEGVVQALRDGGLRAVIDARSDTLGARLRDSRRFRAPYGIVIGDAEVSSGTISVTRRGEHEAQALLCAEFLSQCERESRFE
jgi:threonyl-tRNA synthetase